MKNLGGVLNETTFYVLASAGLFVASMLFFWEINKTDAIEFADPIVRRQAGVSVVEVRARNTTDEARCPEIRIAARDGDGRDLAVEVAQPIDDDGEFSPRESIRFRARLTGITDQEIEEELDEYSAFVWETDDCL